MKDEIYSEVSKLLCEAGIQPNLMGYEYLRTAIISYSQKPNRQYMRLYCEIAEKYSLQYESVERAMRYAIEKAYHENFQQLNAFLGHIEAKLTNSYFIAFAANKLDTIIIEKKSKMFSSIS